MKVKFLKPAQQELNEGVVYYESQSVGLGLRFQTEVRQAIERIKKAFVYSDVG